MVETLNRALGAAAAERDRREDAKRRRDEAERRRLSFDPDRAFQTPGDRSGTQARSRSSGQPTRPYCGRPQYGD